VYDTVFDEETSIAMLWVRQTAKDPFYTCGGCGIGVRDIHDVSQRKVRDLPWGTWKLYLVLEVHRVRCRRCGVKTERLDFLEESILTRGVSASLSDETARMRR